MLISGSRLLVESTIVVGLVSITLGVVQKVASFASASYSKVMGLTPMDFLCFAVVCFLFSAALSGRKILKHLDQNTTGSIKMRETDR